jgi:hypothetical protein
MFGKHKINETQLSTLVDMFSGKLPHDNIADARDLIAHGEYGEALDLLCTQVSENEVPVSAEAFKLIEECGKRMEMEESSWSELRELLTPMTTRGEYGKYENMRAAGASPRDAYREAAMAGLGKLQGIRMLRAVFGMSLEEAAAVADAISRQVTRP